MKAPAVSVILTSYKRPDYVGQAIASICTQTFQDWELIIIDDDGDEQLRQILHAAARDEPRIRLIEGTFGNIAQASNAGLAAARGHWVTFQDDDDFSLPDRLRLCYEAAQAKRKDCIVIGQQYQDLVTQSGTHREIISVHTRQWFMPLKVVHKVGNFRPIFTVCEDSDLHHRLLDLRIPLVSIPQPIYVYRRLNIDGVYQATKISLQPRMSLAHNISQLYRIMFGYDPLNPNFSLRFMHEPRIKLKALARRCLMRQPRYRTRTIEETVGLMSCIPERYRKTLLRLWADRYMWIVKGWSVGYYLSKETAGPQSMLTLIDEDIAMMKIVHPPSEALAGRPNLSDPVTLDHLLYCCRSRIMHIQGVDEAFANELMDIMIPKETKEMIAAVL